MAFETNKPFLNINIIFENCVYFSLTAKRNNKASGTSTPKRSARVFLLVICICGVAIKLNRKYDEDYINRHANGLRCKRNEQKSILCFFNSIKADKEDDDNVDSDNDWNDWESEVEDVMDDDDIITVDENEDFCKIWSIIKDNYDTNIWITLADKANKGAFKEKSVFIGLCEVMVQAAVRKDNNKGKQNIQYNKDFTNFLIILGSFSTQALNLFRQNLEGRTIQNIRKLRANNEDTLTNPNLSFENVAKFKGCIIGSTLSVEQTKINAYEDIQPIINDIKIKKSNCKRYACLYIAAQIAIQSYSTDERLTFKNNKLEVDFSCPIFPKVGPVIRVQNPKHAKKTGCNAIMSGARLLTLGSSTARFE
ncbi:hypothetical protein RhiirC2_711297 [Rhizophagus irregularis]|uniref:Uncharacterized protein n=1 Tax=Rhizophagus irregularis TaxID=588596 RepID=A0A2N1NBG6_9GLOM|nr:hypothetical protein RhiirC2_711297 [Rhizophagus irregularis]